MKELEKLALREIERLSAKVDHMVIEISIKSRSGNLDVEKDIYPVASEARRIGAWASAIIDNSKS
jgi:hypothetical protein